MTERNDSFFRLTSIPSKIKCGKIKYLFENQSNQRFRNWTKIDFSTNGRYICVRLLFLFSYYLSFAMCNYDCDVWSESVWCFDSDKELFSQLLCALELCVIAWQKKMRFFHRLCRRWVQRQRLMLTTLIFCL